MGMIETGVAFRGSHLATSGRNGPPSPSAPPAPREMQPPGGRGGWTLAYSASDTGEGGGVHPPFAPQTELKQRPLASPESA